MNAAEKVCTAVIVVVVVVVVGVSMFAFAFREKIFDQFISNSAKTESFIEQCVEMCGPCDAIAELTEWRACFCHCHKTKATE